MMERYRFCWLEDRGGVKSLCVGTGYGVREPQEVIELRGRLRHVLRGQLAARCIDALETVDAERLEVVLSLLRDGFVVSR